MFGLFFFFFFFSSRRRHTRCGRDWSSDMCSSDLGKAAVFVGTFSADNAAERLKGVQTAIAGHKIEIVDKREDNTDRAKARSNVEDIVNANPDLKLVIGLWSYNGPAIAAAIDALGKKGKILAAVFDEEDGTLN